MKMVLWMARTARWKKYDRVLIYELFLTLQKILRMFGKKLFDVFPACIRYTFAIRGMECSCIRWRKISDDAKCWHTRGKFSGRVRNAQDFINVSVTFLWGNTLIHSFRCSRLGIFVSEEIEPMLINRNSDYM